MYWSIVSKSLRNTVLQNYVSQYVMQDVIKSSWGHININLFKDPAFTYVNAHGKTPLEIHFIYRQQGNKHL